MTRVIHSLWPWQGSCLADDAPGQVGGLTATPSGTTTINLAWNADVTAAPNTATAYEVERSVDGLGSWSVIGTVYAPAVTFSDTTLSASTTRHYRVRATNCNSGGLASTSASATTAAPSVNPPAAPSGLTATATSSTAISLSWTDNANNEDGFKVERSTDNTNWTEIVGNLAANSTSYSATGLTASTLYYFRVRAYNAGGNSAYTSSASATTQSGGLSPSWSLDFSSGTPSGYTLTRASTGTYVDSSGYVASASTNVARLTHNSSGSRLGLLVEGQRANLVLQSNDFNTSWTSQQLASRTANATTSPDGLSNGWRFVETTASAGRGVFQQTANQSNVVMSVYAKADQRSTIGVRVYQDVNNWIQCTFDLSAGTAGTVQAGTSSSFTSTAAAISAAGNGWYRCELRGARATSTTTFAAVDMTNSATPTLAAGNGTQTYTGDSTSGVFVFGAQMEAVNAPATSYIPTTTASVTRSADLAHVLDSAITNWGDPGALVVHFYPPSNSGTLISTDDAATAQVGIEASTTTAARAFWSSGSTSTGTIGTGVQKAVHYWTGSTSKFCINGGTVQSGTNNLTIANTDFVTLGAEATDSAGVPGTFSQYANCVIRKVEFYSGTLTDANLQTITT